jgi:activator of HSP90 ATPase
MLEAKNQPAPSPKSQNLPTRRQAIAGAAVAVSSLAAASSLRAASQAESPVAPADKTRTSLHQEVDFKASPQRIYEILLDSKQFAAFSLEPAEIHGDAGGAFTMFGGRIVGRIIELVPHQRIVQAWRPTHWDAGVYSLVKFELTPQGSQTKVVLDHTGFPEGSFDSLSAGWKAHYWERLAKYLS